MTLFGSVKEDLEKTTSGASEVNADVFLNPTKYAICLAIEKVVADNKVSRQGIEIYKQKIERNEDIKPIVVVKHPSKDRYAVLDGHHRYYAYLELGRKQIDCALAGDYSSVIFYLTAHGYLQPSQEFTESLRQPAVRLHENLKQFLNDFTKEIANL
jgi:hypothetical protein